MEVTSENAATRIINFTDAVVAIAATLLILEPIDGAAGASDDLPLLEVLSSNDEQLIAFAVSFVVIGHFWLLHRRLFKTVREFTRRLYWFNLLWLFSIVFLPYPTALLSGRTADPQTCALYIGTMTVTSLAALGLKILVPQPTAETDGGEQYSRHLVASAAAVVALCAATALALLVPWMHLWGLLLLVPTVFLGRIRNRVSTHLPVKGVGPHRSVPDAALPPG